MKKEQNDTQKLVKKILALIVKAIIKLVTTSVMLIIIPIIIFMLALAIAFGAANSDSKSKSNSESSQSAEIGEYNVAGGVVSYESLNLTESDIEILYKITSAERGDGSQEQQEYVVSVILNRVLSKDYPNNVHDVVFAPNQFQPTRDGSYEKQNPSDTTKNAVNNVVKTGDKSRCAVFFMTPQSYYSEDQQKWIAPGISSGEIIYLFNDVDESHNNASDSITHNFFTKKSTVEELEKYKSSGSSSSETESSGTSSSETITYNKSALSVANGTADEKLRYLFPTGLPKSEDEAKKYMTKVKLPMTSKTGKKFETEVYMHKAIAEDLVEVFKAAQDAGFKIYSLGSTFSYRMVNNGKGGNLSHHSYGIAIDINPNENYSYRDSNGIICGQFWDPKKSEYSIPEDGVLVKAFKAKGWGWGGNFSTSDHYKDYMHFSFTGK